MNFKIQMPVRRIRQNKNKTKTLLRGKFYVMLLKAQENMTKIVIKDVTEGMFKEAQVIEIFQGRKDEREVQEELIQRVNGITLVGEGILTLVKTQECKVFLRFTSLNKKSETFLLFRIDQNIPGKFKKGKR